MPRHTKRAKKKRIDSAARFLVRAAAVPEVGKIFSTRGIKIFGGARGGRFIPPETIFLPTAQNSGALLTQKTTVEYLGKKYEHKNIYIWGGMVSFLFSLYKTILY